jgi:putative membrane protein
MFHRVLVSGAAALTLAGAAQAQGRQDDRFFLTEAMKGDNTEVVLGGLAAERAVRPAVRGFGRMLRTDHTRARNDAALVARRMGIQPTRQLTPEGRQEDARLRRLRGPTFDREFVSFMVSDHRRDIARFRERANGRGPVANLARNTLPVLQHHLDTAVRLSRG